MKEHLPDEQIAEAIFDMDGATRAHLESCPTCRAEQEQMRRALDGLRGWARAAAERPEGFWAWQRQAILRRVEARAAASRRVAWASATALLLAAALLMQQSPAPPTAAQMDPDHALLVEVQRSVRREVPRALEPALLLTDEVSRAAQTEPNP